MSLTAPEAPATHSRLARMAGLAIPVGVVVTLIAGAATFGLTARARLSHESAPARVSARPVAAAEAAIVRSRVDEFAAGIEAARVALNISPDAQVHRTWKATARQLGLKVDRTAVLEDALTRSGDQSGAGAADEPLPFIPVVDTVRLHQSLKKIAARVRIRPRNASLVFLPTGQFDYREGKPGRALNLDAAVALVERSWREWKPGASPASEPLQLTLPVQALAPRVSAADLHAIDGLLGSYSTGYANTATRGSNIGLAAQRINGTVIAPGEVFSYNRTVGPRLESAGFKQAPVILHGELVPGIGGGVCQVSSTLYNAVLLSGLQVVDRSHHAFPVHYLPAGRDATVADGSIDFQFRNSTDAPVCLTASARRGRLTFGLWGRKQPGRTYGIERENISTEPAQVDLQPDSTLWAGARRVKTRGHNGIRVTVYRVEKENGEVVRRDVISHDHYRPIPTVILVGTHHSAVRHKAPAARRPIAATPAPDAVPDPSADGPTAPAADDGN